MEIKVSRKAHFNAAHRLYNKEWSEKKNSQVFGKCNYPNYHGHNYELIVSVTGKINPDTGYVMAVSYTHLRAHETTELIVWPLRH